LVFGPLLSTRGDRNSGGKMLGELTTLDKLLPS
jgi:hypothetical protein